MLKVQKNESYKFLKIRVKMLILTKKLKSMYNTTNKEKGVEYYGY